jgi:accessory Sec system glycosyltransferase GtfB
MKLVLTDNYNAATKRLVSSLQEVDIAYTHVVVQYDGFLDPQVLNPFSYVTGFYQQAEKALHFNEVAVPEFFEIKNADGNHAEILDGNWVVGKILYQADTNRHVKEVIWLDRYGKKTAADLYNSQGQKYAEIIYNSKEERAKTLYLRDGKIVLTQDHTSRHILYSADGQLKSFANTTVFVEYFINTIVQEKLGIDFDEIVINSLSTPLFVVDKLPQTPATLYYQEGIGQDIPGNMKSIVAGKSQVSRIFFENNKTMTKAQAHITDAKVPIQYLGAIERFTRDNEFSRGALTITRSDNLPLAEKIAEAFPSLRWTIAAPTEVSAKLSTFAQEHANINLMQRVNPKTYPELYAMHDIYLDVNAGAKNASVIEEAYKEGMLVMADLAVAKHGAYELVFNEQDLLSVLGREDLQPTLRQLHRKKGQPATAADYQVAFGNARKEIV